MPYPYPAHLSLLVDPRAISSSVGLLWPPEPRSLVGLQMDAGDTWSSLLGEPLSLECASRIWMKRAQCLLL